MKNKIEEKVINNKIEYFVNGEMIDRFGLLACAIHASTEKEAWEIMNMASRLYHRQDDVVFNTLYGASAMEITRNYSINEYTIQRGFKENIDKIFNGKAKLIEKKNNNRHIPDVWIELENEEIPVEVKLDKFDNKALKQLERYMKFYNCNKGIAVAKSYTASSKDNIIFISIDSFFQD